MLEMRERRRCPGGTSRRKKTQATIGIQNVSRFVCNIVEHYFPRSRALRHRSGTGECAEYFTFIGQGNSVVLDKMRMSVGGDLRGNNKRTRGERSIRRR